MYLQLGVDNAPSTQILSFSIPLIKSLRFGVSIVNDRFFALSETDITINLSYKLKISEASALFFRIK
ncbi:MAG: hypothetical protein COB98_09515 [Flavobacteriaceae bacterium]|nr:MAG: hypothetical protein COB98_09515 [Flavobacteriaceae bacterium]